MDSVGYDASSWAAEGESWTLLHTFSIFEYEKIKRGYIWRQKRTEIIVYYGSLATRREKEKHSNLYGRVLYTHKIMRIKRM